MKKVLLLATFRIAASLVPLLLGFDTTLVSGQSRDQTLTAHAWLREMQQAYDKRTKKLNSLSVHFAIDDIIKGVGEQNATRGDALFSDPMPAEDLHSNVQLDYFFENGKLAYKRSSSKVMDLNDPTHIRPQQTQYTFNGEMNNSLVVETSLPLGTIDMEPTPSRLLLSAVDCFAVNLWRDPRVVLEAAEWFYDGMVLEEKPVTVDGTECRRVSFYRKGSKRWTMSLDVTTDGNFLPLQYQTWSSGRLSTKVSIKYASDETLGSRITQWSYIHHGSPEKSAQGQGYHFRRWS